MATVSTTSEPPRVVALGGGTGLPGVLGGLAGRLGRRLEAAPEQLTGIVTVTDDGGSSGRLRRERGILPPGDVRNCLVAMGRDPHSLAEVFQYRYREGNGQTGNGGESNGLGGHTLGNLILTALAEKTGCFLEAIERASRVLAVRGRILPSTLDDVVLEAEMSDGEVVRGETAIAADARAVRRVRLAPVKPAAAPGVVEAIERADIVILAPGSLFTSLLPNLLVTGVTEALARTRGLRVLVANAMTQPGETDGFDGEAHLRAIEEHAGRGNVDLVLAPSEEPGGEVAARYRAEGQVPVRWDAAAVAARGAELRLVPMLDGGPKVRHDPRALAEKLLGLAMAHRRRPLAVGAAGQGTG